MPRALLLLFLLAVFIPAHAQAPEITSFSVSPISGSSGFPYSFTWTLSESAGAFLLIPCIDGIKIKNTDTGAAISCGVKTSFGGASSGGALIKISNASGNSKTFPPQLIPKDLSGVEYSSAAKTVSVTVATNPQPIEKLTSSATTIKPGVSVSITWSAPDTNGVNLSIECKDGIRVSSPSYTDSSIIPCGKIIFSKVLAVSDSLILTFTNLTDSTAPYKLTLYPAITATTYDGTHTSSLTLDVASDIIGDPEIISFTTTPSLATIYSKEKLTISWETINAKGVNLKISCAEAVTAATSSLASPLPCGKFAFLNPLPEKGSLELFFQNTSGVNKTLSLNLVPAFKNNEGYSEFKSKSVSVTVRSGEAPFLSPAPSPAPTAAPTPTPIPIPTTQPTPTPTPPPQSAPPPASPKATQNEVAPLTPAKKENLSELLQRLFPAKEPVSFIEESETAPLRTEAIREVTVFKDAKLFYLIPVKLKIKVKIKADDGRIISTKFPWWSFLTKF